MPEKPSLWERHKKKIVAAAVVGAAVGADRIDAAVTESRLEDAATVPEGADAGVLPEAPLSPEVLRGEYEKVAERRDIYEGIAGTRHFIRTLGGFFVQSGPGFIETAVSSHENISYTDLEKAGVEKEKMAALVDLGAFDLARLRSGQMNFEVLAQSGLKELVFMEDRDPMFFLNYDGYKANEVVPLNRHGSQEDQWTMADMKQLVEGLQGAGIQVVIGFWGNTGNKDGNPFLADNWESLRPVFPTSDDVNPLSFVKTPDGREMSFADYIVEQYDKLKHDFQFNGLFLGDGLMGFRTFLDPYGPYTAEDFQNLWTDFYKRIWQGIKAEDDSNTLWAYDCMGNGPAQARVNGLDLKGIAPYIDTYIFQSYGNDAWGDDFMDLPGYDLKRDALQASTLPAALKLKTRYSVGLGDSVEGWHGTAQGVKEKQMSIGPHAKQGTLGVWSNELLRQLNP